jgi:VIT1/CCC1 family predicted Fe2+/Mn2+ transporter
LNYSNWLKKTFPKLGDTSEETVHSYIREAKSSSQLLREFIKVLGFLLFVIPFNLFLLASGIQSPLYWVLLLASFLVGSFVSLYCEQQLIIKRLRKIVAST